MELLIFFSYMLVLAWDDPYRFVKYLQSTQADTLPSTVYVLAIYEKPTKPLLIGVLEMTLLNPSIPSIRLIIHQFPPEKNPFAQFQFLPTL